MADGQYKFSIGLDDKQLSLDAKSAAKIFDQLVKEAQKAGVKIDEALNNPFEELMKKPPQLPPINVPTNVLQATQQFKGLNIATQQLVRELPAATMGLNTFFLAISNNLPIFADQVKEATEANKELIAQGKPTTGVFKQIIRSLLSWQTALLAGVTVLSMYGKEIGEWVKSLFKVEKHLTASEKAQKGLNEALEEQGVSIGDDIVKLKSLQRAWVALGNDFNARKQFVDDNKSAFDDLGVAVNNVVDADRLLVERTPEFMQAMKLRAQAAAAQKLAQEQYEKGIAAQIKRQEAEAKLKTIPQNTTTTWVDYDGRVHESYGANQAYLDQEKTIKELKSEEDAILSLADAYFNLGDAKQVEAASALKAAKISPSSNKPETTTTTTTNSIKNEADERKKTLERLNKELAEEVVRTQEEVDDAEIAAIKDGAERKRREIKQAYERRAQEIDKYEADLKAAQDGVLTTEQTENIAYLRRANTEALLAGEELVKAMQEKASKEATDTMNEYLIAYGTFQEKLLATTEKYADLIANAQNEGERKMYEAERDAILAQFEVEASAWAKELVNKSVKELKVMAEGLQSAVDSLQAEYDAMDTSDTKEAKDLLETINYLNAQIAQLKERLGEAGDAVSQDNWAGATEVLQGISRNAQEAADALAPIDEVAASILSDFADAIEVVSGLTSAIKMLGTAATAVQGVFAIFTVAIQLMSKLIKVSAENAEAAREVTEALDNYRNALKALNEEAERASRNTIFGEDSFGLALTNLEVARERLTDLNRLYAQLQSKDWDMHNLGLGNAQYSKKQQDFINSVNAKDAALVADMRTASQKFFGANKNIVTADLADFYNDNGKLDLERLKAWYELYGEYLSEEQKHIVNQLIEGWEVYYDSTEAATNYLKGIFGELGDDITKSMVDAFANGTDAAQAFKDSVSDIMRNFASDMVEAMYIAPLLEQAQADVEAIWNSETMSHEQKLAAIAARMAQLGRELNDTEDDINESLGYIDRAGKDNGFDIFDGADRQGATKGIAQASQDSIDELNGRATAIQGHTYSLAQGQKQLINDSAQALKHLAGIELNTAKLHDMERTMNRMAGDINQMAMRGVKMI